MKRIAAWLYIAGACAASGAGAARIDLSNAVVVVRSGAIAPAERTAATVLVEEVEKRTGIRWPVSDAPPAGRPSIRIGSRDDAGEGFRISASSAGPVVSIEGDSARGALFGVGDLLRRLEWERGAIRLPGPLEIRTAPDYPIRGHQLGFRAHSSSYDAWNVAQYEQYIRELALFGVNSIEGIPFQDARQSPVMTVSRDEMNRAIGDICYRYGLDYWVWLPAEFDLKDSKLRAESLARSERFFRDTKELSGVFFPGGDPGHNPPELVLPFLEDLAKRLMSAHPKARVWLSLQMFDAKQVDYVFDYIQRRAPVWLGGLVVGPSSPPLRATRERLPRPYKLRLYPDLTHNKLSQFEVPQWDQAYALTHGREAINPRPVEFARIHQLYAPLSDGFISYSDGAHDDVNKVAWSALSWSPDRPVREILLDYARLHFGAAVADRAADGILALEKNWLGPLVDNGSVEGTLLQWQSLETAAPQLASQWRWQMLLMRAYYDADVRRRSIADAASEREANAAIAEARARGSERAIEDATTILNRPVDRPLRPRILELAEMLFRSVGLQTSTEKYHASDPQRGAVLDFIDLPLNNRWWLEDEFRKIRALESEAAKVARLEAIAAWENPGPGSFYDDLGHVARSPRERRRDSDLAGPDDPEPDGTTSWWWDRGKSRARLSWQITRWPGPMVYEPLDSKGRYVVRSTGFGRALLRINGQPITPSMDGREMGQFKEFSVPEDLSRNGRLILEWSTPAGEAHLNWRQQSRLAEVWLLKR